MVSSRRRLIAGTTAFFAVASLLGLGALGQVGDDPRNTSDEYFDAVNDAQCYDHHLEDGFIPFGHRFVEAYSQLPIGETVPIKVEIRQITQFTSHRIEEMTVTVNREDAPHIEIVTPDTPEDIDLEAEETLEHGGSIETGEIFIGAGAQDGYLEAEVMSTDPPLHESGALGEETGATGTLRLDAQGRKEEGGGQVRMDLDREFFQQRGRGNYTFSTTWDAPHAMVPMSATVKMVLVVNFTQEATEVTFAAPDPVLFTKGERTTIIVPVRAISEGQGVLDFRIRANVHHTHNAEDQVELDDGVYFRFMTLQVEGGDELIEARQIAPVPVGPTINLYNMLTRLVGFIALFLIVAALFTGGVFGKKSRRFMNTATGGAKKRVLWHSSIGFVIVLVATLHFALALIENLHDVSRGLFWGGMAWALLVSLGFTGYYQVRMIKKWNYRVWRHVHLWTAVSVLVFVLVHVLVEGTDLSAIRDLIPYTDRLLWPRGS